MSDCCASTCESKPKVRKCECPVCHQVALDVSIRTMMQHMKEVWRYNFSDKTYFYCRTKGCDVVYFTEVGERLNKVDIRTHIGIKEQEDSALICYCFGVSKAVAAMKREVKDFVIKQTKESTCACETSNPSGRCCLKDFPKFK